MNTIEPHFIHELVEATRDVFRTMVCQDIQAASPPVDGSALKPGSNVVGTVAFAGSTSGVVAFYSTLSTARELTAMMLGIEPSAVNGELPDAIGELTNMIAGSFRTRMAHQGNEAWAISVPSVTIGSDFHTKYISDKVLRALCPFGVGSDEVFVELIITRRK
jgi:chemotaxis protein CheX